MVSANQLIRGRFIAYLGFKLSDENCPGMISDTSSEISGHLPINVFKQTSDRVDEALWAETNSLRPS
jgi:hypothetical protein